MRSTRKFTAFLLASLALMPAALLCAAPAADEAAIRAHLAKKFPEVDLASLAPSPIDGLYEIRMGGQVAYVTADGKHLVQGDIFDVDSQRNLTEERRTTARLAAVNSVGEKNMIIFEPTVATRHTVTVFTDIDCGYCRKLHRQIADYNAKGIRVRYMFFPRSGPATDSWYKADSVWCAKDRNSALTRAKSGEVIQSDDCGVTPVAAQYELGQSFGIRGTPAIITDTGELIPGYVPPDDLASYLDGEVGAGG